MSEQWIMVYNPAEVWEIEALTRYVTDEENAAYSAEDYKHCIYFFAEVTLGAAEEPVPIIRERTQVYVLDRDGTMLHCFGSEDKLTAAPPSLFETRILLLANETSVVA